MINPDLKLAAIYDSLESKINAVTKQIGPKGDTGAQGLQGAQGPQGVPGKDGVPGRDGKDGKDGTDGKDGKAGPKGLGISSVELDIDGHLVCTMTDGSTIDAGSLDELGAASGTKGSSVVYSSGGGRGEQGETGPQGATGATGAQGIQGIQGATGSQGPAGNDGAAGATGAQGPQGATGAAGQDGNDGAQGPQGIQGATGAQGPAGQDGADGAGAATEVSVFGRTLVSRITAVFNRAGSSLVSGSSLLSITARSGQLTLNASGTFFIVTGRTQNYTIGF